MINEDKKLIVVLGMHRSGTSVLTHAVQVLGADLGSNLMPPREANNPKGFFEDLEINHICEQLLVSNRSRWNSIGIPDAKALDPAANSDLINQATAVIDRKLDSTRFFCFKNPRLALQLPFWNAVFKKLGVQPRYLISVRHPLDVADSLFARDKLPRPHAMYLWLEHNIRALAGSEGFPRCIVRFDTLLEDPDQTLARLGTFLNVNLAQVPPSSLEDFQTRFLSANLKHHAHSLSSLGAKTGTPSVYRDLFKLLTDLDTELIKDGSEAYKRRWKTVKGKYTQVAGAYELAAIYDRKASQLSVENARLAALIGSQPASGSASAGSSGTAHPALQTEIASVSARLDTLSLQLTTTQTDLLHASLEAEIGAANLRIAERALEKAHARTATLENDLELARQKQVDTEIELARQVALRSHLEEADRKTFSGRLRASRGFQSARSAPRRLVNGVIRPKTSGIARRLWISLPVPYRVKAGARDLAFQHAGPLFSWTRAYRDWSEFHAFDQPPPDQGRRVTEPGSAGNEAPKHHTVGVTNDQSDLWNGHCTMLEFLAQRSGDAHEQVPDAALAHAEASTAGKDLKVSVIIPTWNREGTITKAIDSVLDQSYPVSEIIVSDDGSTDSTLQVLQQTYPQEIDSGQLIIISNAHAGVSAARNAGLRRASGDLISYLDSDNRWRRNYVLIMVAAFAENSEIVTAYAALRSHDIDRSRQMIRATRYDRRRLLEANFIDLNIFMHRNVVYQQLGGFDEELSRLVDWDLILRYTKHYTPVFLPFVGVDYYLSAKELANITHTVSLDDNRRKVLSNHFLERVKLGLEDLRIAYFVYDYPARSQTFVFNEIRWLLENGYDVKVYFAIAPDLPATIDFKVDTYRVSDAKDLARLLLKHRRNICHSHFAYPGVTNFVRPACALSGTHFTFMPHAVDIFHHLNRERNQIGAVANDPRCMKVFVYGDFHRAYLTDLGVPREKIAYAFQAVDSGDFLSAVGGKHRPFNQDERPPHGIVIARFIEKKGLEHLLAAVAEMQPGEVRISLYGYGPLDAHLRKRTVDLGLENTVTFAGSIDGKEALLEAYANADFLVAPCVQARDGDMDGFPTVILEAISAGLPVVTTAVSAIPDYLRDDVEAVVVEPANPNALAAGIRHLLAMSDERRAAMVRSARSFLAKRFGTPKTMRQLLDVWSGYSFEIVLVTFNVDGYDDRNETYEIIRRIVSRTTTRFTLTIVDNNSDESFWKEVVHLCKGRQDIRLIRNRTNVLCGPATNIAIRLGTDDHIVYICSKEGFIKDHGWERSVLDYMRTHPDVPMAGYRASLPRFTYGRELVKHPDFHKFRGREFAEQHPNRVFSHVQGGVFAANRPLLKAVGGYNPNLPQANMDVEMSFWLEANGYALGTIPEIASITTKTLPTLDALLSESICIAHPLTLREVDRLDALADHATEACNLCGAIARHGPDSSTLFGSNGTCNRCGSTPFGRSMFRILAGHFQIHRGLTAVMLTEDQRLTARASDRMFAGVIGSSSDKELIQVVPNAKNCVSCVIVDTALIDSDRAEEFWNTMLSNATDDLVVFSTAQSAIDADDSAVPTSKERIEPARTLSAKGQPYERKLFHTQSHQLRLDWRPIEGYVLGGDQQGAGAANQHQRVANR